MIKRTLFIIQMAITLLCSSLLLTNTWAAESLDRIVATVNDAVITQSELNLAIHIIKKQLESSNTSLPPAEVLRKQVLDQLINKKLQMQVAEQAGIHVSDSDVNKAIQTIATGNHITTKELYEKLASQGMNKSEYLSSIKDEIALQQIQQKEVGDKISISSQDVDDFMRSSAWRAYNTKEYHLEDILIALPEAPTSEQVVEAKKRAEKLLVKIQQGASFRDIAVAESNNNSALQGGDLGWRKLPEIPAAFADQLILIKVNDTMGPIQTPNGFHLVRLAGMRGINTKENAEEQRKQIQQLIFQRKLEEGLQSWTTRLRSAASINTHPEG